MSAASVIISSKVSWYVVISLHPLLFLPVVSDNLVVFQNKIRHIIKTGFFPVGIMFIVSIGTQVCPSWCFTADCNGYKVSFDKLICGFIAWRFVWNVYSIQRYCPGMWYNARSVLQCLSGRCLLVVSALQSTTKQMEQFAAVPRNVTDVCLLLSVPSSQATCHSYLYPDQNHLLSEQISPEPWCPNWLFHTFLCVLR